MTFCEINIKAFFVSISLVRENLREVRENKKHIIRTSAVSQNGSAVEDGFDDDNEEVNNAKTANLACMAVFVIIFVFFNIIFWVYALEEHGLPINNFRLTVEDEQ